MIINEIEINLPVNILQGPTINLEKLFSKSNTSAVKNTIVHLSKLVTIFVQRLLLL